jgi:ABC-type multidrug transport system fused ATPase/permease subunit
MENNKYKQLTKIASKMVLPSLFFVGVVLIYIFDFKYIFETVFAILLVWFVYFILRYFRVLKNHELQNVFINQYILKRSYKPKLKTSRQKIEDIKKIQKYNQEYNSNFNNFTKYNTNLSTNNDFTFDYLEIKQYNNKNRLATIQPKG